MFFDDLSFGSGYGMDAQGGFNSAAAASAGLSLYEQRGAQTTVSTAVDAMAPANNVGAGQWTDFFGPVASNILGRVGAVEAQRYEQRRLGGEPLVVGSHGSAAQAAPRRQANPLVLALFVGALVYAFKK